MKYRIFILGLITVLFTACAINEEDHSTPAIETEEEEFYATIEGATTKVYVDEDLKVLWHADDRVSIFNKYTYNQQYRFTGNTGANSGSFQKVPNEDFITGNALDYVYAVYPYQETTEISNQGVLSINLPATQAYAEDSFGVGANTMVSCSEGNELLFKNLCGYIMLKLYGDDVTVSSISLKGNNNEPLAGKATVSASVEGAPSLSFDSSATDEITLTFDTPVTLGTTAATATTFWLVVPPTTFVRGITLTVTDDQNGIFEKATTMSLEISRNTLAKMASLQVVINDGCALNDCLTIDVLSDGRLGLLSSSERTSRTIQYSINGSDWTTGMFSATQPTIMELKEGDHVKIVGDNSSYADGYSDYCYFTSASGLTFNISGNINSLLDSSEYRNSDFEISQAFAFYSIFSNCTGLISADSLMLPSPSTTQYCYRSMFSGCKDMVLPPHEISASILADGACYSMFLNCESLAKAPEIKATTLTGSANCERMFYSCKQLLEAPLLLPDNLTPSCYNTMFWGCQQLIFSPDLTAQHLAKNCYQNMFASCSSLQNAPRILATSLADYCYRNMFRNCINLKRAPDLSVLSLARACYQSMFQGCTSIVESPVLPALSLTSNCYEDMFRDCSSLRKITCLALSGIGISNTYSWVEGVANEGVFVKNSNALWEVEYGDSAIPYGWEIRDLNTIIPEAVDLGLPSGIKWASFNLGASSPEEYGDYYAWGEIEPYYSSLDPLTWKEGKEAGYNWASYKWCWGSYDTQTKYCTNSSYGYKGFTDGKTVLDPEDDAAHAALGGNWRMPTDADWTELRNNCTWKWTGNYNGTGVAGRIVTSKVEGYKDKSIFLPAAGSWGSSNLGGVGSSGDYWSSLCTDLPDAAWIVFFYSGEVSSFGSARCGGKSVRPVYVE